MDKLSVVIAIVFFIIIIELIRRLSVNRDSYENSLKQKADEWTSPKTVDTP
jgi:inner membrane protein involved in colicin E2 resistance